MLDTRVVYKQSGPPHAPHKKVRTKAVYPFSCSKNRSETKTILQIYHQIAKINKFNIKENENNQSTDLFIFCFHKSNNNQAFFPKPKLYSTFYHFVTQQKHIWETMTMLQIYQQNQQF